MKGVAVHWTVTPARVDHAQCEADWAGVIAQHARQGYNPSPAYNWGACQHGVRFEGRGWGRKSAANGTTEANRDYWAVVALNAPGDTPSPELLATLATLIDEAPDVEARVVKPHSDFFPTACCGDEIRAWVRAGAQSPTPPSPPVPSLPVLSGEPAMFASVVIPGVLWETFRIDPAGNVVHSYFPRTVDTEQEIIAGGAAPDGTVQVVRQANGPQAGRADVWWEKPDGTLGHAHQNGAGDWAWHLDGLPW